MSMIESFERWVFPWKPDTELDYGWDNSFLESWGTKISKMHLSRNDVNTLKVPFPDPPDREDYLRYLRSQRNIHPHLRMFGGIPFSCIMPLPSMYTAGHRSEFYCDPKLLRSVILTRAQSIQEYRRYNGEPVQHPIDQLKDLLSLSLSRVKTSLLKALALNNAKSVGDESFTLDGRWIDPGLIQRTFETE